jgi:putative transposase
MEDKDYLRFIHDLFEFNDENPVLNTSYYFPKTMEVGFRYFKKQQESREPRKLLVEILIFTLMPNHFHLLLKPKREDGISRFMQKLGVGYTNYFNQKHERVGGLFQGKFKAVSIDEDSHFIHLPYYIHLNPLDLINYRNRISIDWKRAMGFLENYKWSSFLDYIGKKNFPSVTQREFLLDFFGGEEKYKKETMAWLKEGSKNLEKIKEVMLE